MTKQDLYALGREIKLVVCDLDGTLLNSCGQISPVNRRAAGLARESGVFVTICSGRPPSMLYAYSRALGIRGPLAAANGGVLLDTRTGKILYQRTVDPGAALPLLRFCRRRELDCAVLSVKGCFFSRGSARIRRVEQYNDIAAAEGLPQAPLFSLDDDYSAALSGDIYKILIYETDSARRREAEEYLEWAPEFTWTSSEKGLLDISARGVNKGDGVRRLAEALGIERGHICVFGDYLNDIPMMEQAGLPIAMGNAHEAVKEAALAVTDINDEDGVARAIEKYILRTKAVE